MTSIRRIKLIALLLNIFLFGFLNTGQCSFVESLRANQHTTSGLGRVITDWERDELSGQVRSVQWYRSNYLYSSGNWVEGDKQYAYTVEYDKDGNDLKRRERHPYFYNCYNDVQMETAYDAGGYRTDTLTFARISRLGGSPNGKEINFYDSKDRIIERIRVLNDGRIAERSLFIRDPQGQIIKEEYYEFAKLTLVGTYTYVYRQRATG